MDIKLKTDFIDYYDHWFDRDGLLFERLSTGGMSRREMFTFLEEHYFQVPAHGAPAEIYAQLDHHTRTVEDAARVQGESSVKVVVYLDERAHRGKGKLLVPLVQAEKEYPEHFCSRYFCSGKPTETFRYVQVGDRNFWLKYISQDWRSNVNPVIIVASQLQKGYHRTIRMPLFAIDFVLGETEESHDFLVRKMASGLRLAKALVSRMYAVDFNIAPGLRGTDIEKFLQPKEAAEAIKRAIEKFETEQENVKSTNSRKNDR